MASGGFSIRGKKVCVQCGEIFEGANFCPNCGKQLTEVKAPSGESKAQATETRARASEARVPIEDKAPEPLTPVWQPQSDDAKGEVEDIIAGSQVPEQKLHSSGDKRNILPIALVVLLLVVAVLGYFVFLQLSPGGFGNTSVPVMNQTVETTTTSTTTTSTTTTSTTTSTTTTTASTSSTLPYTIACVVNLDCGNITETPICYQGDVYSNRVIPICKHPNTPGAVCTSTLKKSDSPVGVCANNQKCLAGKCVYY